MTTHAHDSPARQVHRSSLHTHPTLPVALIVLIGFALRLGDIGLMRLGYDHSYPAYQALGLLDAGIWPLTGQPSSIFLDNPALMAYLQTAPLLIERSPWVVVLFVVLLNSLGIWFVFATTRDLLDYRAGLLAAFLFAVNPWLIWFSRASWVQALHPFYMAVAAWGLWAAWAGPDRLGPRRVGWRFFAGGVAVVLMTQSYVLAWGVLPAVAVLTAIYWRRVPRRALLASTVLLVMAFAVYAAGMVGRAGSSLLKLDTFINALNLAPSTDALLHAVRLVNGMEFLSANALFPGVVSPLWSGLEAVLALLLGAALFAGTFLALRAVRAGGRSRRVGVVLLVWLALPVLVAALLAGAGDIHPHYLLLTVPAGTMLAAWALDSLYTCRSYAAAVTAVLLLAAATAAASLNLANQRVAAEPIWPAYDGWSLSAATRMAHAAGPLLDQSAAPAAGPRRVVASGDKALLSSLTGHYVAPIEGAQFPDYVVVSASDSVLYMLEGVPSLPRHLRPFFDEAASEVVEVSAGRPFMLRPTKAAAAAVLPERPQAAVGWPSEAGLTLTGYRLRGHLQVDGLIELIVYWRVDDLHPDRAGWFAGPNYHLVDSDGHILSNVGEHGGWGSEWVVGDLYIEHVIVPIPRGTTPGWYTVDAGLYDPIREVAYTFFPPDDRPTQRFAIPLYLSQ